MSDEKKDNMSEEDYLKRHLTDLETGKMGIIVNNITILRTGAIQAGGFITS